MAACFDPLGNAVHTALSFPILGEDVLITGAGPIGLMALSVARQAGARHIVVTDLNPFRREMAKRGGATLAVDPSVTGLAEVQRDLGMAEGFDVGLEMSGSGQALSQMIQAMVPGGKIALLGIPAEAYPIPWEKIVFRMLTLKGIYGREMFETWYQASVLVEQGLAISSLITHHFAAEDHEQAFDIMSAGRSGKVILHWQPFDSNSLAA
ncbi:MAG: zinc-binding dehydrogenase [Verrucomicrobiota bacterium]